MIGSYEPKHSRDLRRNSLGSSEASTHEQRLHPCPVRKHQEPEPDSMAVQVKSDRPIAAWVRDLLWLKLN